jgi:hypothetical protein
MAAACICTGADRLRDGARPNILAILISAIIQRDAYAALRVMAISQAAPKLVNRRAPQHL